MFRIRLKELRESRELSQQSFADSFGVAQSTVGGWEAGKREPNFETTIRIAKYFNVSVDYLLGVENAPIQRAGCLYDSSLCFEFGAENYRGLSKCR